MAELMEKTPTAEVRASLAETLGLDDREIQFDARLDELGVGAFELEAVLGRLQNKLKITVTLLDLLAHAEPGIDPVHLDSRPWLHGDGWMIAAENACTCCTVRDLETAVRERMSAAPVFSPEG